MHHLQNVVKGIDKRISYNLRLIGAVIIDSHLQNNQLPQDVRSANSDSPDTKHAILSDLSNAAEKLQTMPLDQRREQIKPKMKKVKEYTE